MVPPKTATAPSSDDHAPAGGPDNPTSVDATSTAVTAVCSRRRVAPGTGSERPVTRLCYGDQTGVTRLVGGGRFGAGRVGGISTFYLFVSNEAGNQSHRHRTSRHRQAAYRPRDVAKQREPARTSDQSERQARGGFRVFAQVSGLGCIDLGDRRSRVQISAARQQEPQVRAGP